VRYGKLLIVEGRLRNQENVVSVKADVVRALEVSALGSSLSRFSLEVVS
jgi:hypothetical protein